MVMVLKILDIRHQETMIAEDEKSVVSPIIVPVYCLKRVSGRESQQSPAPSLN